MFWTCLHATARVPELLLGIWETLRNEVDGLVRLVLVGLHRRGLRIELSRLWLVGQRVLDKSFKKKKEEEAGEFSWQLSLAVNVAFFSKVITQNVQQKGRENMPENAPQALRKRRAVQRRKPSPRRSAYTSRTPPWTSITGVRETQREQLRMRKDAGVDDEIIIYVIFR